MKNEILKLVQESKDRDKWHADIQAHLKRAMALTKTSSRDIARKLEVPEGEIRSILNDRGTEIYLSTLFDIARCMGLKININLVENSK